MPSKKQIRTKLGTILPFIKTRLASETGLDAAAIHIAKRVDDGRMPVFHHRRDIILQPGSEIRVGDYDHSAGRDSCWVRRKLRIVCRSRMFRDRASDDTNWLTDGTDGHYDFEDDIIQALEEWYVIDDDANNLTYESLAFMGIEDSAGIPGKPQGWGSSAINYEIPYRRIFSEHSF